LSQKRQSNREIAASNWSRRAKYSADFNWQAVLCRAQAMKPTTALKPMAAAPVHAKCRSGRIAVRPAARFAANQRALPSEAPFAFLGRDIGGTNPADNDHSE
jgi:hypothetical protein